MLVQYFLAAFLLLNVSLGQPVPDSTTEALVVVSDASTTEKETKVEPRPPQLKSMHVTSNVRNRYARTVVTSKYVNPDVRAQQATFSIVLPDTAFVAGFVMEIDDKQYEAYVKEKAEAKQEYDAAVAQGIGAAHVAVSARDSNKFTVSVNVEPESKVVFNLTYEELLVRKHGKYEVVINLHPGQLIKDLGVDVNINETRPIINVEAPALRSGNEISNQNEKNEYATINKDSDGVVHVSFHPTVVQQKVMAKALLNDPQPDDEDRGISGQFVVEYDVERDPLGGEVLVNDGYFVHFFAPSDLKPIPKHVVFVLDVSGSMYGRKIEQLKEAMKIILEQLNSDDYFNLVKFHTSVQVLGSNYSWLNVENPQESELPQGIEVNKENIKHAQEIVSNMTDEGLTNIYDALIVGLRLTSKGLSNLKQTDKHKPQPIIVFLTDGQANVGESRYEKIIDMVEDRSNKDNKAAVFSLAFGNDASDEFLKELAIKNSGFSRKIYEAADASLQLQDFYKTISSPLLTNVNFKYSENQVKNVTKHKFDILFQGGEFVVAGKIDKPTDKFVTVEGLTIDGKNKFETAIIPILPPKPEEKQEYGSLERLWAYLTIKQLLDKKYEEKDSDKNATDVDTPEKQATKLALKYSFVTPVTSLVVVKPNETDTAHAEQNLENSYDSQDRIFGGIPLSVGGAPFSAGTLQSLAAPANAFYASKPIYQGQPGIPGPPAFPGQLGFPAPSSAAYGPGIAYTTTFRPSVHATHVPQTTESKITAEAEAEKSETEETEADGQPDWLKNLINAGKLTIDNKDYEIGNNGTSVENKQCQVESLNLSGNCTLLTSCPRIYPQLDSFETYKSYFCSLESGKYAGVCCAEPENSKTLIS